MSVAQYLLSDAVVSRQVSVAYFIVVVAITLNVLGWALYTRNRNAIAMFLFASVVWPAIELAGLLTGWRVYIGAPVPLIFVLVGVFEDAGWVTLAYMAAEALYPKIFGDGIWRKA